MNFKNWLKVQETSTTTASVATYARRLGGDEGIIRRTWSDIKKFGLGGRLHTLNINDNK